MNNQGNIFSISVEQVQEEAERFIGRMLSEEELYQVKKGIEMGVLTSFDIVLHSAITEAIKQ
jgi:hypothetical protein